MLIQQRESLAYVGDEMRHAGIQIMVVIDGHLVPAGNRAAVARCDDAYVRIPDVSKAVQIIAASAAKSFVKCGEPRRNRTFNWQIRSRSRPTRSSKKLKDSDD
jgi:hypothetical protein